MSVSPGQVLSLTVEKPAAGGRMIARSDGQVVLVAGAIPGERLTARVERVARGVAYAQTLSVEEPSADRRNVFADPLCGGCLYAHIDYPRQLAIKAEVVADAFARIGRIVLSAPVLVAGSADEGYRMRARLHLRGGRAGFFREGSHEVCDVRGTRQLLPATCDVLERLASGLRSLGLDAVRELEVSENVEASQRAVHLEAASPVDPGSLGVLARADGLTGLSLGQQSPGEVTIGGDPYVTDALPIGNHRVVLRRHVLSFFQGNRFLLRDLAASVVGQIEAESGVVDLYSGAGLFAVTAAVVRRARVIAVEGDRTAARDLEANARASGAAIEPVFQAVEEFTASARARPRTLIVDPPRTGMSREALDGAIRLGAREVVYVSCDIATLARDSRRLLDAGHAIRRVDAFDLFPNTPHVETVVRFENTGV
jgi:23S rRNA (uracil1939-C5)-methyltransferase